MNMAGMTGRPFRILPVLGLIAWAGMSQAQTAPDNSSFYERLYAPFSGDLPEMRQRRMIRVLVSPSRTNFFFDGHRWRGLEYELLKAFEQFINRGPRRQRYITHLIFMPQPFNGIIEGVATGRGDIGAAGLTVTPGRAAVVDFTHPYLKNINEILVSRKGRPAPRTLEDLAGARIIVVRGSSYAAHLAQFNQALAAKNLPLMEIVQAEAELDAEDLLELLDQGLIDYTVVDAHIARLWAKALPNIRPQPDFVFHYGGKIAWAVRKNAHQLKTALNSFIDLHAKPGRLLSNLLYRRYFESARWLKQPLRQRTLKRFQCYRPWFELFGDFYDLSWSLIAAVAFVESSFDPRKKSHAGAYGLMQVRPAIKRMFDIQQNLYDPYANLLAGSAYLAWLRDNYYADPVYSTDDRINFTLAAYNAGPTKIRQLQREAKRLGLDPFKWFYNVELVARRRIGQETVNYVSRVRKTRTAIRMLYTLEQQKRQLRQQLIAADTP